MKSPKPTWKELADALGFDSRTLRNWKRKEGAPQTPDPSAWSEYVKANGLGDASSILSRLRLARLKEVELRCEKLRQELDIASKKAVSVEAVDRFIHHYGRTWVMHFYNGIECELPGRLDGLPAMECRRMLRQWGDRFVELVSDQVFDVENPEVQLLGKAMRLTIAELKEKIGDK